MLRRQKHVLSQSTTPFACTLKTGFGPSARKRKQNRFRKRSQPENRTKIVQNGISPAFLFLGLFFTLWVGPVSGPFLFPISGRRLITCCFAGRLDCKASYWIADKWLFRSPRNASQLSEQVPCRSAEVKFFSVFLCQRCREIWCKILVKFSALRFPGFGCATWNFTKFSPQKRWKTRKFHANFTLLGRSADNYPLIRKYYENNSLVIFDGLWTLTIFGKGWLFWGITREIRNFLKNDDFRIVFFRK